MNAMLSDGRLVPTGPQAWAEAMRRVLIRLQADAGLSDIGDLRKLMAHRPMHYLGGNWEAVIEQAGQWLDRVQRAVPAMPPAALRFAQAGDPLVPADGGPVGCPA